MLGPIHPAGAGPAHQLRSRDVGFAADFNFILFLGSDGSGHTAEKSSTMPACKRTASPSFSESPCSAQPGAGSGRLLGPDLHPGIAILAGIKRIKHH